MAEGSRPRFNLAFFAVNKRGELGSASLYAAQYAAFDGTDAKLRDSAPMFEGRPPS